jgi:uncharacterized repeat protein (TIGR03837 family)
MQWDLFCRVIDNFGDIGVCWRLSADLAGRGDSVRLWTDDARALAWMAPHGAPGVEVRRWPADDDLAIAPHPAVIEAFGCHLPAGFVQRMAERTPHPVWINLEYLSAEDYVERSHALRSPQLAGAGQGLDKWFFYPGFTSRTGGLLREPDLARRQAAFDAGTWLASQGVAPGVGERRVSLFCYANEALAALIDALADAPTLLLVTSGITAGQVRAILGPVSRRGALRVHYLPALTQRDYDHLLWACDLNLVRGEDSFVRAQWAGKPFLWQIYRQQDGVHAAKLAAFDALFLSGAAPQLAAAIRGASLRWNGLAGEGLPPGGTAAISLPPLAQWEQHCRAWRARLDLVPDLTAGLRAFVRERR